MTDEAKAMGDVERVVALAIKEIMPTVHTLVMDGHYRMASEEIAEVAIKAIRPHLLAQMVEMDEDIDRDNPGWMDGTPAMSEGITTDDTLPVALAHVRLEDDGLFADLQVLDGTYMQPEHSPVKLYIRSPAMSGWRDIETAPMDDTLVLLAGGMTFCEARERYIEGPMIAGWNGSFWLVAGVEGGYVCVSYENPKAWMPLPTPPEGGE